MHNFLMMSDKYSRKREPACPLSDIYARRIYVEMYNGIRALVRLLLYTGVE